MKRRDKITTGLSWKSKRKEAERRERERERERERKIMENLDCSLAAFSVRYVTDRHLGESRRGYRQSVCLPLT